MFKGLFYSQIGISGTSMSPLDDLVEPSKLGDPVEPTEVSDPVEQRGWAEG